MGKTRQKVASGTATDEIEAEHDHIAMLGRGRAQERLAVFLLALRQRWRDGDKVSAEVPVPMTRAVIADYLGLTAETVSWWKRSSFRENCQIIRTMVARMQRYRKSGRL